MRTTSIMVDLNFRNLYKQYLFLMSSSMSSLYFLFKIPALLFYLPSSGLVEGKMINGDTKFGVKDLNLNVSWR